MANASFFALVQRVPGGIMTVLVALLGLLWVLFTWRKERVAATSDDETGEDEPPPVARLGLRLRLPVLALVGTVGASLAARALAGPSGSGGLATTCDALAFLVLVYLLTDVIFTVVVDVVLVQLRGVEIPRIFYQMLKAIIFLVVFMPVLSTHFNVDITPLLTHSAVFTMVIGLALQDTLGNLFSGIATELSRPYRVGEWIALGDHTGQVREVTWRSTTIRTLSNDYVIIPNSEIAKTRIVNFSRPTRMHLREVDVGVVYGASPDTVSRILIEAVQAVNGVRPRPRPHVFVRSFDDFAVTYLLRFYIDRFQHHRTIESEVRRRIWYFFKRNGIEIPFPIRDVNLRQVPPDTRDVSRERLTLLTEVDFLQAISEPGLIRLSESLRLEIFHEGEDIVVQGEEGNKFYIIDEGEAEVWVEQGDKEPVRVNVLGRRGCFGEMSLLTGQKRSATVRAATECRLLVVDKENFRAIMQREPKLAERISEVLVRRQKMSQEEVARLGKTRRGAPGSSSEPTKQAEEEKRTLMRKIITFFGL